MTSSSITQLQVAVAVVLNDLLQVLLVWNPKWQAFSLPMTKLRPGPPWSETAAMAAVRTGAEALGAPVLVADRFTPAETAGWFLSGRTGTVNHYRFDLVPIDPHPQFAGRLQIAAAHFWASPYALLDVGTYEPVSPVVPKLVETMVTSLNVPHRVAPTTTLVITRSGTVGREFLVRWNPHWRSYAFPAAVRDLAGQRSGTELAAEVAATDLGPNSGLRFAMEKNELQFRSMASGNRDPRLNAVPTLYRHLAARADWPGGGTLASDQPVHWATSAEVRQLRTAGVPPVAGAPRGAPGPISPTAYRIAKVLDLLDDGGDDDFLRGLGCEWFA